MKYRIIKESDGNGRSYYTGQILKSLFGVKYWRQIGYWRFGEIFVYKFDTEDKVMSVIRGCIPNTRVIVKEGEL